MLRGLFRQFRLGRLTSDKGELMFLNQRRRRTAALVVTLFLLAALPAAAGGTAQVTPVAQPADGAWEKLVAQLLTWLGSPWSYGQPATMLDTSPQIDPLGQH